ncbi:MAG: zinc metallopeptidase [Ruminococcaceae bacterium]|nr:zinc metallopeptidase [Oscillospiraceae bacterium]
MTVIQSQYFYLATLIPAILLSMWAQFRVRNTFNKYGEVVNSRRITGAQAARAVLDANGLQHVDIVPTRGFLTDHYDPRTDTIALSEGVYNGISVAAIGVATHEVGHAIQFNTNYVPVKVRNALVPVVSLTSKASPYLILIGLVLYASSNVSFGWYLALAGVIFFALSTLFHLVTLPLELNASNRAKKQLGEVLAIDNQELKGVRKVLSAAALTYLSALIVSLLNLLRLIGMLGRKR